MTPRGFHRSAGANRRSVRGSTLLEVLIAAMMVVMISFGGLAYYSYSRLSEIRMMQEQSAFNLAEIEIERWQAEGYTALTEFTSTDVPWGYNSAVTPPSGDPSRYPKSIDYAGATFTVTAFQIANTNSTGPKNFRWEETIGGVTWAYRRLVIQVDWGNGQQLQIETRMSQ